MMKFEGRTAVVTGASSGIGRALAVRFAQEGMNVVMADVQGVQLREAAEAINITGARVVAVETDVSREESVLALGARAKAAFGKVHIVFANAGVITHGTIWDQSLDEWTWTLGVNLWGVIHTLRAFIPGMLAHGEEGHIMITSSAGGLTASSSSSYAASKYAVLGIAEGLAVDLKQSSLDVSVLCPGGVKTALFKSQHLRPPEFGQRGTLTPEIAQTLATLAAPDRKDQMSPEMVADLALEAIRKREFYVVPMQPHFKERIRRRNSDLEKALAAAPDTGV